MREPTRARTCWDLIGRGVRLLGWLSILCLSTGCMVKVAYNNLDRLVRWQTSDFIDFTAAQRRIFDDEFTQLWYWHRTTQLPEYAAMLEGLARDLDTRPVTHADLGSTFATLTRWGDRLELAALPLGVRLLESLDDAQVARLAVKIREDKGWRDTEADDHAGQREAWQDQLIDRIQQLTGRLDRDQRALIRRAAVRYQPEQALWEAYIDAWQTRFIETLDRRAAPDFQDRLAELVAAEEYGSPLDEVVAANEALSRELLVAVLGDLTSSQRARMTSTLAGLAGDFRDLVAQAPEFAPDK